MIWQTKEWWNMLKITNQVSKIIELEWLHIEKREIGFGQFWLFVLWYNYEITQKLSEKLSELCKNEKALFIQIESNNYWEKTLINSSSIFSSWYYKKFITPFSVVIDLKISLADILSLMKPKGRYNIRLAAKKWIVVSRVDKTWKNIKIFYDLMHETIARDNFSWNILKYYEKFLENISDSELFIAYKEDQPVAAGIFIFSDKIAIYYYWASTSKKEYRSLMAPYLLQYTAIEYAKEKWCVIYDFLWVAGPNEINSPLAWVSDFKLKLSKDRREVSQSFILINKRFLYTIIKFLRYVNSLRK